MSQFQPNAAPGRSFISKINLKFSNLSLLKVLTSYSDKDGNTEDDTLIHNAFVRFFDEQGQPYPEWLGVSASKSAARPTQASRNNSASGSQSAHGNSSTSGNYSGSQTTQYQPIRTSYNSNSAANLPQYTSQSHSETADSEERGYTRRSSSKLQEMYNKSRKQSIPGAGYNAQQTVQPTSRQNLLGSLRLRDRIINGSLSQGGGRYESLGGSRASWGRNQG